VWCIEQFAYESVLQRISSLMRLCGVGNRFTDESVLQQISSLTRLCGVGNKFANKFVHP
jgi:endonuclease III